MSVPTTMSISAAPTIMIMVGPPAPAASEREPKPGVVGRPAPRLVGNPGPSPVRLITPITGTVGHPTGIHLGCPAPTLVRHLTPLAVGIEIARPYIVRIRVLRGLRTLDLPVAVAAPLVEFIPARGRVNFVLRIVGAVNLDDLARLNLGAALVGQDFRFALAHDQKSLTGGIHLNAINPRRQRMYAHIRGVNLRVRLGAIQNTEIHQA